MGAYPTELKHPKGAVGQNGTTGGTGAYPTDLGHDKGAVGNVQEAAGGAFTNIVRTGQIPYTIGPRIAF